MGFVLVLSFISQMANLAVIRGWGVLSDRFANKSVLGVATPLFNASGAIYNAAMAQGLLQVPACNTSPSTSSSAKPSGGTTSSSPNTAASAIASGITRASSERIASHGA